MAVFDFQGKHCYIDNRLKNQLDKQVIPDLKLKDEDVVFIIDGKERAGKSKLADMLGSYASSQLGRAYDVNNFCMTPEEFKNKIMTCPYKSVVIYDEAHRGMASARALSEINNILKDLMMEMGQKNLFVLIVIPTFFLLDRYAATLRARGLFHVYKRKHRRGFWCYFNEKNKSKLYRLGKRDLNYNCMKWPFFRGRFTNQWMIDEGKYRDKKKKSFMEKPRATKVEKYIYQRDVLILLLRQNTKLSQLAISKLLKAWNVDLKRNTLSEIEEKMRKMWEELSQSGE